MGRQAGHMSRGRQMLVGGPGQAGGWAGWGRQMLVGGQGRAGGRAVWGWQMLVERGHGPRCIIPPLTPHPHHPLQVIQPDSRKHAELLSLHNTVAGQQLDLRLRPYVSMASPRHFYMPGTGVGMGEAGIRG